MDTKKVLAIVVLVVVIALAVVFAMRRNSGTALTGQMDATRNSQMAAKIDKIDNKTFEVFSETLADWNSKYAPDKSGHWKNPKTGEYTIVPVMKCASCGALIPYPEMPMASSGKGARRGMNMERQEQEVLADYMCPKCGKHAYIAEGEGEK